MNLNERDWAEFKVSDLFNVKYGVNFELNACIESDKTEIGSVNFVARTAENNGVSARVMTIDGVEPQKKGLISVAGGGSVLSTFLQNEPFYSGRDLYTLDSKDNISDEVKMFIITIIEQNKYKYSYGRQANKTLPDLLLKLPINDDGKPDYIFMEDYIKSLHYKPLTTKNKSGQAPALNVKDWKGFTLSHLLVSDTGDTDITQDTLTETGVPVISSGEGNTGVIGVTSVKAKIFPANTITMDMFGFAFPRSYEYKMVTHARVFSLSIKKHIMTTPECIFMATILNDSGYKYAYGRMCSWERIKNDVIQLPIQHNSDGTPVIDADKTYSGEGYVPDWQFMEDYIKALPYGDRLENN